LKRPQAARKAIPEPPDVDVTLTGDMGHGVDQVRVNHGFSISSKWDTGNGKHTVPPAAKAATRKKENTPGSQRGRREHKGPVVRTVRQVGRPDPEPAASDDLPVCYPAIING
jgi:hypothetical protein